MQRNILIITGILFALEFYVYQAFKTLTNNNYLRIAYVVITLLVYLFFLYEVLNFKRTDRDHSRVQLISSVFMIFMLPKLLVAFFLLIGDIGRGLQFTFQSFGSGENHFPERRKFLSIVGIGSAALLSGLFLDGIIFGKYRHSVRKVKLKIAGLPKSFKGYKIVQISDVHSGSFFHPEKLQKAIDLINEQKPDLVLFTGDMVNNYASEFKPFIPLFKSIQSKDGKFSILGNHDYGDYGAWESMQEKAQNIPNLIELQKQAGFEMLRNEHRIIEKNGEKLYLLGVENWGEKPFPQYGDLDKAALGVPAEAAKILMSHDPTHFDYVVKNHPSNVQLTLSGHTHGMQFGLDLKNVRWSPVQYRYKKWADLYESNGKLLYVNRGFGVIGYPGRVGIDPEITLFELS
ncbi:metallophosphoesterase [Kaistella flava (ex Peng et al. 2021)]|uniref:Metallophosphoesterase n=1 Tax=Kaistella flava (ex Peng et al. 2021) TaxID=2038776 RepID=A0A7M2YC65_9FLAO|nr:metallophosphoesterase [Kaistella flava (ex Peng et al. 2021)]QOW11858.1 metallophosphoesterase [Kaistella flava (ex Peng et al. 2021)]